MTSLPGGDSATPKKAEYLGKRVWGVYVAGDTFHVWTKWEVAQLVKFGITGVMPIVVPPQNEDWWMENYGYATLEALVREAKAWGVPPESPLCLDIEQGQAEKMSDPGNIAHAWAVATRQHNYRTWTYSGKTYLANDRYGFKWLADWPEVAPTNPEVPQGYNAWQYATDTAKGIDLDVFQAGRDYMTPDLKVVVLEAPAIKEHAISAEGTDPATDAGEDSHETTTASPATSADSEESGAHDPDDATSPITGTPPEAGSGSAPHGLKMFQEMMKIPMFAEAAVEHFRRESPK